MLQLSLLEHLSANVIGSIHDDTNKNNTRHEKPLLGQEIHDFIVNNFDTCWFGYNFWDEDTKSEVKSHGNNDWSESFGIKHLYYTTKFILAFLTFLLILDVFYKTFHK
jgi:hypothetical protein